MRRYIEIGTIIIVLALFVTFINPAITGHAVKEETKTDILKLATSSEFIVQSKPGWRFCLIIPTEDGELSYNVDRNYEVEVTLSENYFCDGQSNEDFIVQYLKPEYFASDVNNANFVKAGHGGKSYYFLPSKYLESGGNVLCNQEFQTNYCEVVDNLLTTEELILSDTSCCITGDLNAIQKKLLIEHYKNENYQAEDEKTKNILEKKSVLQLPSSFNGLLLIVLVVIIIAAFIVVYVFHNKGQEPNEAEQYLISGIKKGYQIEKLASELVKNGWNEKEIRALAYKIKKGRRAS